MRSPPMRPAMRIPLATRPPARAPPPIAPGSRSLCFFPCVGVPPGKPGPLPPTLKSFPLGDAADRHHIACFEYLHGNFVSDRLRCRSIKPPFSKSHEIPKFLCMPLHWLVYVFRLARTPAKLHGVVAVFLGCLDLRYYIGRNGYDRNRPGVSPLVPHLRHMHFCAK